MIFSTGIGGPSHVLHEAHFPNPIILQKRTVRVPGSLSLYIIFLAAKKTTWALSFSSILQIPSRPWHIPNQITNLRPTSPGDSPFPPKTPPPRPLRLIRPMPFSSSSASPTSSSSLYSSSPPTSSCSGGARRSAPPPLSTS